ncbi:MAG: hypothetical protein JKY95_05665 [Planctomycetaceae bacterium]|nr:hypothetical protein [Planctomycetaceae bacterium]
MPDSQKWISRHWKRLQWGQFLGDCADRLAFFFIVLGCLILLVKLFIPSLWPHTLWLFALLPAMPLLAWRQTNSHRFTRTEAAALLDQKLEAGGLLMTLSETPDDHWQSYLPEVEMLWRNSLVKIRPKRFVSLLALPLAFAMVTCIIPVRETSVLQAKPRKVSQQTTEELEAILETLEEADILEEEDKAELKKELEKFAEQTKDQPLTHEQWETADFLRQNMQMKWEKNERGINSASSAIDELLSSMANSGEVSAEQLEQFENAMGENLQAMARKALNSGLEGMSDEMKKMLENLANSGKLSMPGDAQAQKKMMEELKEMLKKEAEKLAKQRGDCQGLCEGGMCEGNQPGKGGISRGRGDAEMLFGEESDLDGTKFKEIILPPGVLDDPTEKVLRLTKAEPETDPAQNAPRNAVRKNDPASGRATWDRKLSPKYRGVVQKFFNSNKKSTPIPNDEEL